MPTKRYPGARRFVVLLDYNYGPGQYVMERSSNVPEVLRTVRRYLSHWDPAKIVLFDQVADRILTDAEVSAVSADPAHTYFLPEEAHA